MAQATTLESDLAPALESRSGKPEISVVVTIYNEIGTIDELSDRLRASLEAFDRPWEVVFVDDGSADGSRGRLRQIHERDPRMRVVLLKRNVGQHPAMAAGMQTSRADIVVTMDGDLQNDPSDIPKLVTALEREGVEVASGRRSQRADALMGRQLPSRAINAMLRRLTRVEISDYGCAFNAYRRAAFEPVLHVIGRQKFTKALVLSTGAPVVEVDLINHPSERLEVLAQAPRRSRAARPDGVLAEADTVGGSSSRPRVRRHLDRGGGVWRRVLGRRVQLSRSRRSSGRWCSECSQCRA